MAIVGFLVSFVVSVLRFSFYLELHLIRVLLASSFFLCLKYMVPVHGLKYLLLKVTSATQACLVTDKL